MKYCRLMYGGQPRYGLVEGVDETITRLLLASPHSAGQELEDLPSKRVEPVALHSAALLAPVEPSKIVCVGRNYREHAAELGNEVPTSPLIFLKPPSALVGSGARVRRPAISERVDYEGELGVIIGRRCRNLGDDEDVLPYVLGYTCVNDVTARDLQNRDGQWTRAKGFDTFCPVGPVVVDDLDISAGVGVQTRVNGELRQDGNTRDFIFPLAVILRYIARVMTLLPGDLVATGTPKGVSPVVSGDVVEVTVEGVGTLRNQIVEEPDREPNHSEERPS
jgi:2-keto-4-pentenoate hydratase/2-oxohepta-3-ene-1,7-dioic acid hydratase in catechol pathway